jgi:hypothetical protein
MSHEIDYTPLIIEANRVNFFDKNRILQVEKLLSIFDSEGTNFILVPLHNINGYDLETILHGIGGASTKIKKHIHTRRIRDKNDPFSWIVVFSPKPIPRDWNFEAFTLPSPLPIL